LTKNSYIQTLRPAQNRVGCWSVISTSIFPLKIWREGKKFVNLQAEMISKKDCIEKLKNSKNVIVEKFGVRSMKLFGSVARNEQKETSDVDVCVDMEPSLLKRSGLKIYLEEVLNCKVDVLRNHKNMDPYITQQINKDGILIFN
jgi:predicted nucleotidyltransferase